MMIHTKPWIYYSFCFVPLVLNVYGYQQAADIVDIYNKKLSETEVTYKYETEKEEMRKMHHTQGVPDEQRLMRYLFMGYEKTVRPVRNASTPVVIRMGLTLTQIFDMDEKNQVLVTNVWLDQEWEDEFMRWNPVDFANITTLRIPCHKLWLPDIVLYNNAAEYTDGLMPANAMVDFDGNIFWPVPTKLQSSCKVDVTYFPFDEQTCTMKFGSWTYDGFQVDITNRTEKVDLSNYVNNGEWELVSIEIIRNVVYYGCCDEPFPDVTFITKIRRRTLYYMYNVIFPCIMMSALTLLVFCLPPDSGEKIALGITVLLAFSVFMLAVAENLPETSEFVPLISIYLTIVMALTSMSVIMTVFVLNLHHRGPNKREVPRWIKNLLIDNIAPLLCLNDGNRGNNSYYSNEERFIKNMSLKITLDNIQQALQNENQMENNVHQSSVRLTVPTTNCNQTTVTAVVEPHVSNSVCNNTQSIQSNQIAPPGGRVSGYSPEQAFAPPVHVQNPGPQPFYQAPVQQPPNPQVIQRQSGSASSNSNDNHRKNKRKSVISKTNEEILNSLKRILEKHEKEDRDYEVIQEWRRVAQCMDRILFYVFFIATFTSTLAILVIAPAMQ